MPCTDLPGRPGRSAGPSTAPAGRGTTTLLGRLSLVAGAGLLAACAPGPASAPAGGTAVGGALDASVRRAEGRGPTAPNDPGSPPSHVAARRGAALAEGPPHDWPAYRRRAAQRMVDANAGHAYDGEVQEPLLAIPVLQIDLHADGSVQRITVLRHPQAAQDTVRLAEEAVRRAAPFAPVGHLPKPWRLTETFLFDAQRRFKPRTLDD